MTPPPTGIGPPALEGATADGAAVTVPDATVVASPLEHLLARGRVRATLTMLGPAFVASVAYVDPGNFATNIQGGAKFGYLLLWVVLLANLMAMLIQYLSAKLGIATDRNLPELCRERFPRWTSWGLWIQAELMAMSTDIAEFLGAALGSQPAVRRSAAGGRADHRRDRLRDARAAIARLPALRAGDQRAAGPRVRRLPLRDAPDRALGARVAARVDPRARRQRLAVPRGRDHRRDRDAARDLPALGADQPADAGARRRRAPARSEVRAARRDHRPRARRADQPGDAGRGCQAVPRQRAQRDRPRSRALTPSSASWSAAARHWPSRSRCWPRACRHRASAPTPARS